MLSSAEIYSIDDEITMTSDAEMSDCEVLTPLSPKKLSTGNDKRIKLSPVEFWKPSRVSHCSKAKDYLAKKFRGSEIFEYIQLTKANQSGSNWMGACKCCNSKPRTGGIGVLLDHFGNLNCNLSLVPEEKQAGLKEHLRKLAKCRTEAYARDHSAASAARDPGENVQSSKNSVSITDHFEKLATRRQSLLEESAIYFLQSNLPASHAESKTFRRFLKTVSGGKVDHKVAEVLKRKAMTYAMDKCARACSDKSLAAWKSEATRFAGTLIVDGWTAAKLIGTIGVTLCCLLRFHVLPLLLCGIDRSRARDYVDKLETAVDWNLLYFCCTDGASNMISFADILHKEKFVLHNLCAAHGFSLTVHYIAKVFEDRSEMFSRVGGIIAFFNRSNQRLALLRKEYGGDISFIKMCKTRFAYQTLALMRVFRLRVFAQKAILSIKAQKLLDDEEQIDTFSKLAQVEASLNNDKLFKDVEAFCRITLPVLLAMREVDRGTPMAGFVYWLNYQVEVQVSQITSKLVAADPSYRRIADDVTSAVRFVWEKRHRPVLSFAYLTNPLLQPDLSQEADVFALDASFLDDVDDAVLTLVKKRYLNERKEDGDPYSMDDVMEKFTLVKSELSGFLRMEFNDIDKFESKRYLAASFWKTSRLTRVFKELSWCAAKVHSMPVVTSKLERFFSHVGNVQTEKRACLTPERASLYAAAHQQLLEDETTHSETEVQARLVELVKRCESIETEEAMIKFDGTEGFSDLETWIEGLRSSRTGLLYSNSEAAVAEPVNPAPNLEDAETETTTTQDAVNPILDEYADEFESRQVRRSGRSKKQPRRLNL